jgi:hypothetical protein
MLVSSQVITLSIQRTQKLPWVINRYQMNTESEVKRPGHRKTEALVSPAALCSRRHALQNGFPREGRREYFTHVSPVQEICILN